MNKWYSMQGSDRDVALSSKISLVRNIDKIPFPCRMSNELRKSICKKIYASIQNSKYAGEFDYIELNQISGSRRMALYEKGYISRALVEQREYSALLLSKDERVSIMLCEEEHIRLTVINAGSDLREAYKIAAEIDNMLINNMHIAFDKRLGFLTSNPMMLGTGMTASLSLQLPAINARGMMSTLSAMAGKLGFSIKPLLGGNGSFFELSNTISLGITEENAIENLLAIAEQIIGQERRFRKDLIEYDDFEDKIYRAVGTLKMARRLTMIELTELLSLARLGVGIDTLALTYEKADEMLYSLGTASIIAQADDAINKDDAEKIRAQYIRDNID